MSQDKYFGALYDNNIVQEKLNKSAREDWYEEGMKVGRESGLSDGREIGLEEEKKKIAKSMISKNMDIDLISEITGLTEKEIKELTN